MALIRMWVAPDCCQRPSRLILWIESAFVTYWRFSTAVCPYGRLSSYNHIHNSYSFVSGSNGSRFFCVKRVWLGFCIKSHVLIVVSGPNQSKKFGVLDSVDGIVSPDFLYHKLFWWIDCTIRIFPSFSSWIRHSCIPQKHGATITIFTSFYIKFKY